MISFDSFLRFGLFVPSEVTNVKMSYYWSALQNHKKPKALMHIYFSDFANPGQLQLIRMGSMFKLHM